MKLDEFKAWFEGFTESMEGKPNDKQWKRIKEQVKKIDGVAVSYPVYIDRYWRRSWDGPYWAYLSGNAQSLNANRTLEAYSTNQVSNNFDGVSAMYAAGKAEALAT